MFSKSMCRVLVGLLLSGIAASIHAGAFNNITVGQAGLAGNCTVATIQAAINLAAQNPGPDTIWVTRDTPDGYYLATQALTISNQDLEIVGGFDDCFDETPSGYTDISGNGNAADPIFRIRGGGVVTLNHLTLTLGDADNGEGGGVDYAGSGILIIDNSVIEYNHSLGDGGLGGGVKFRSLGGQAELAIARTRINNNSAYDGGGIMTYSESAARPALIGIYSDVNIDSNMARNSGGGLYVGSHAVLGMYGPRVSVYDNTATSSGGGMSVHRANVAIAAPAVAGRSLFDSNRAAYGGGISLFSTDANVPSNLKVYSTTPNQPITLARNVATQFGGAIYTNGHNVVCFKNARITSNRAPHAAAIWHYGWVAQSGDVYPGFFSWNYDCDLPPEANVPCSVETGQCNLVDDNVASIDDEVIRIEWIARADWTGVHLVNNFGKHAFRLTRVRPILALNNSAFAGNTLHGSLIHGRSDAGDGALDLFGVTVARNAFPNNSPVLDLGNIPMGVVNSVFSQPQQVLGGAATETYDRVMIETPVAVLPPGAFHGTPVFAPSGSQAKLVQAAVSPGVDAALCAPGAIDGEGNPRNIDLPDVNNGPGTCDLGAYETPATASDLLFRNSFE